MSTYKVPALDKTIAILELLERSKDGLTTTEIYKTLDIPKTSVFSIMSVLEMHEFVKKDPDGHYNLGVKLFHLGMSYLTGQDIVKISRPYLEQLTADTGFTTHLGIMDKDQVMYLDKVEANSFVQFSTYPGKRSDFHITGVGKAIAAFLSEEKLDALLNRELKSYTEKTINDAKELRKELLEIRKQGYALENEEGEPGVGCIAAPIFDAAGQVIAAISLTALSTHLKEEMLPTIIKKVEYGAEQISNQKGKLIHEKSLGGVKN